MVNQLKVKEPSAFTSAPFCRVLPSQAEGSVGTTPLGAEHSTMLTPLLLLGAAKAELAGTTTLMFWPLSKGPGVHVSAHCAAFGRVAPLAGGVSAPEGDENAIAAKVPAAAVAARETATRLATCRIDMEWLLFARGTCGEGLWQCVCHRSSYISLRCPQAKNPADTNKTSSDCKPVPCPSQRVHPNGIRFTGAL